MNKSRIDVMGYILDLDGTLVDSGRVLPGAVEFVAALSERSIPFVVMTNSVRSPLVVREELTQLGIAVPLGRVLNPITAINQHLAGRGPSRIQVVGGEAEASQVQGSLVDGDPDVVVLLDFERIGSDYRLLQGLFETLERGTEMVAASRSLTYRRGDQKHLDTGAFVELLERASGRSISNFGKPSPRYFEAARCLLGVSASQVVVVGDDVTTDVAGGLAAGFRAVLVPTGKYRPGDEARYPGATLIGRLSDLIPTLDSAREFP